MNRTNNTPLTPFELEVIDTVGSIGASLSIAGSGFILASFALISELRKKAAFRMVAFLSIADVLAAISNLLPFPSGDVVCLVQAWMMSIFELASIFWSFCIALTVFLVIVKHKQQRRKWEIGYHIFSWGLPVALAIPPQALSLYGNSGGWCWIASVDPNTGEPSEIGQALRFIQFYGPLWMVLVLNTVMYMFVIRKAAKLWKEAKARARAIEKQTDRPPSRASSDSSDSSMARSTASVELKATSMPQTVKSRGRREWRTIRRLFFYPPILFLTWIFGSINRVYLISPSAPPLFYLTLLHRTFSSLQGFFNFLAYGTSATVRTAIAKAIRGRKNAQKDNRRKEKYVQQ